uniref:Amine oxidase domain-containing protein n=1 Tax=Mola mola TaxID=94237 RepID=A0A3Q3WHY1_MOLML
MAEIAALYSGNMVPRVVVVGCGISGVAAAHRLVKAGFHRVQILEATGRSGGRIHTGRLGNNVAEIGASYIHGPCEENPVFCLARDYGLLHQESRFNFIFSSISSQRLSSEDMSPVLEMYDELMNDTSQFKNKKETPWASLGHFMRSEGRRRAAERCKEKDATTRQLLLCAFNALLKDECSSNAAHTLDEIDVVGFGIYKNLRGLDCTIRGGYEGLVKSLLSDLPADIVTYNRPVRCVHWNNTENSRDTVNVECDDGEKISANHVILTVPLGYLKKHHSSFFCPPLPAHKLHSIHKLGFGTCNKIYVEFDQPWWDADCDKIYLVWRDEEDLLDHVSDIRKSWIRKMSTFTVLKPSDRSAIHPVLCGWISGHESEYMETLSDLEVRNSLTELIHTFTGNPRLTPRRILCTKWFHNPWTCGSYSHPAKGCSEQDLENMMEPLPTNGSHLQPLQVLFAGEATHPYFYSTVHGAVASGWREADRLISHYS